MRFTNLHCFSGREGCGHACKCLCSSPFACKNDVARTFVRIANMEPTPVEMQSFTTVQSVFLWAQLKGDPL